MLLAFSFLLGTLSSFAAGQLKPDFYAQTCPNVVSTVTSTIKTLSASSNVVPPSTLRLLVHDCFVQGCDASILINSTPDNQAERDAPDNKNIASNAYEAIVKAKQAVEAICPGVVSCSDVLALAARDAIVFLGGPSWDVPLGRRDGLVSKASLVPGHLPGSDFNVAQLVSNFASVGLTQDDLVILTGGHTVGFSHCNEFSNRLYNFNSTVKTDPSLESTFAKTLEGKCPQGGGGGNTFQAFDVVSPFKFDNQFYINLQAGKGLLFSDQVLFQDPATKAMVGSLAASQDLFFKNFVSAMIKMSSIGVKTGSDGEIRKECSAINTGNSKNTPNPPVTVASPPPLPPSNPPASPPPNAPSNNPINPPPATSPNVPPNNPVNPTPPVSSTPPENSNPGPSTSAPPANNPSNPTSPAAPTIPISNPNPGSNPSPSFSPPESSNNPPVTPATPSVPDNNPSPSFSPPESSDNPPVTPATPSAPDPTTPSSPGSEPRRRFPGLPFHFPKIPRFPGFPRIPGFPGSPGGPGSQSQNVRSGAAARSSSSITGDATKRRRRF